MEPQISIVIPVKNGGPWLDACLCAITEQTLYSRVEIIIIDSGSTDETHYILKKYPVRLYTIPPHDYNHGLTRNLGVQYSRGKYIVMTVQDATAGDHLWLQKLMDGFSVAENIAGVCGQQIVPHDRDKNPVDWFRPHSEAVVNVFRFSEKEYNDLTPAQRKDSCSWDNVTAIYKKEVLEKFPFREMAYGEDAVWAKEVLLAGYTLVYNTGARVLHYHNENRDFIFRRTLTVMYFRYRHFGYLYTKPRLSLRSLLSEIKVIGTTKGLTVKEKWRWMMYNKKRRQAIRGAYNVFFTALRSSEKQLDAVHRKFCEKPPVPLKPRLLQT